MLVQTQLEGHRMKITTLRNMLSARGLAPKTVKDYTNAIMRAQDWMRSHDWTLDDVPATTMVKFVDQLPRTRASRNQMRCALKAYWEITGRDDAPLGAIRVPRSPRMKSKALTPVEAKALASHAKEWEAGGEGLAVLFGLYMGLRAFEIAKLRWDEFDDGWDTITFVGKMDFEATLPVHPAIQDRMQWWRQFRRADPTSPNCEPGLVHLFPSKSPTCKQEHITGPTVWSWVDRVSRSAGIGHVSSHRLRHTCLTEMNDKTKNLRAVQEFARHSSPEVTSGYTRVTNDQLSEMMNSLDY